MTRRFNLLAISAVSCVVLAVTAAYALTGAPKTATAASRSVVSVPHHSASNTIALASRGDGDGEENDDRDDAPDPTSAKITPAQAAAAARAAYPGSTVTGTPQLENEDGVTVYGVHITAATGKKYDVKVDGNTGKVLKSEADDHEGADESDGDGETNDDGPDGK